MSGSNLHRSWEISAVSGKLSDGVEKASGRNAAIDAAEKSDTPVVPKKPSNKGKPAETVEGRGATKGNAQEPPACRTQGRENASTGLERVRETAKKDWISHFERGAAQFLLSQLSSAYRAGPGAVGRAAEECAESLVGAGKLPRLDMLEKYIKTRLCAPLALVDLANAAGVCVRTLNLLCHQHHGVAPMDLLRNIRLDAARERLLAQPEVNVSATALEFGFGHLGRFSAYYRDRFGELPKHTRACAR